MLDVLLIDAANQILNRTKVQAINNQELMAFSDRVESVRKKVHGILSSLEPPRQQFTIAETITEAQSSSIDPRLGPILTEEITTITNAAIERHRHDQIMKDMVNLQRFHDTEMQHSQWYGQYLTDGGSLSLKELVAIFSNHQLDRLMRQLAEEIEASVDAKNREVMESEFG
ncbi:hypothetical protein J8273_0801 [Carpediemonas membranifera]|uniref:Uncharacterized protein n=1 Tax=Carpediemonas membranifera TaxID=201153 RepID=A0A8J6C1K2_9EUKA|nr:hypothetical protein J8273_0801 [Carpediemonas membranifera]|eukprot:KAG9397671.1 hypothetical protein J8273_0801 [Carpediemonas membranifera]